jgi:myo-inositol-1(or 4)-monophosphatase
VIMADAPDSTIVGEEGGAQGSGSVRWYVDPIDGTSNFARGIAHWCVSIAATLDGRSVAGVVYDPVARNLFSAHLGAATLNDKPLVSRAFPDERSATLVTSFPNPRHLNVLGPKGLDAFRELVDGFRTVRNLGSGALSLATVAAGWADATIGFRTNPWDIAAGMLILEQAGGRYLTYRNGEPDLSPVMAPDYCAVGKGAGYPVLERIVRDLSRALHGHKV